MKNILRLLGWVSTIIAMAFGLDKVSFTSYTINGKSSEQDRIYKEDVVKANFNITGYSDKYYKRTSYMVHGKTTTTLWNEDPCRSVSKKEKNSIQLSSSKLNTNDTLYGRITIYEDKKCSIKIKEVDTTNFLVIEDAKSGLSPAEILSTFGNKNNDMGSTYYAYINKTSSGPKSCADVGITNKATCYAYSQIGYVLSNKQYTKPKNGYAANGGWCNVFVDWAINKSGGSGSFSYGSNVYKKGVDSTSSLPEACKGGCVVGYGTSHVGFIYKNGNVWYRIDGNWYGSSIGCNGSNENNTGVCNKKLTLDSKNKLNVYKNGNSDL